jgi:hypothetical protein
MRYSPSSPLTKRVVESLHFPYRSHLELPSQYFVLNELTYRYDYISPIDLWMEEFCGDLNQPWYSLGLLFHRYDLALFPDLRVTVILPDTCISLFWLITKHKGRIQTVDKFLQWLHWIFDFT